MWSGGAGQAILEVIVQARGDDAQAGRNERVVARGKVTEAALSQDAPNALRADVIVGGKHGSGEAMGVGLQRRQLRLGAPAAMKSSKAA